MHHSTRLTTAMALSACLWACHSPLNRETSLHPLRLGNAAIPLSQVVDLEIDPRRDGYAGEVAIRLAIRRPSDSLRLHAEGLEFAEVRLDQGGKSHLLAAAIRPAGLVMLKAQEPFAAGEATLRIRFTQEFNTQSVGLYKVEAAGASHAFTQFEAWDARKAFPCFDEPAFKIPWTVRLKVPAGFTAIGNYPIASRSEAGDWTSLAFETSRPMPSYLVALAVGEFDTVPIPGLSVPGRIVTMKGQARLAAHAAAMAPRLLKTLEDYFGQPSPYPKLDFIAVPEFMPGAMENPGAITFRENLLLFDSAEASLDRRRSLASIMAHELAHLWFGDLVTMTWWDDLWLNESFASWMGDRAVDAVYPEFRMRLDAVHGRQWAFHLDAMRTARTIRTEVRPTDNPMQNFDALAYAKGQEVLQMLEAWLGAETFRTGIRAYVKDFAWKNADAAGLWSHLSAAAGQDLAPVTAGYLDQSGVPLVEVASRGKTIELRQRRFLLSGEPDSAATRWKIPLVLRCRTQSGTHRLPHLLEDARDTLAPGFAEPGMVCHPNDGESGYYRWNLPAGELDSLCRRAQGDLSERERLALLGNLSALSKAGLARADELLARLPAFAADSSPQVLHGMLEIVDDVDHLFIDSASEVAFARYVSGLLGPVMDRLGWAARSGEDSEVPGLRARLLQALALQGRDGRAIRHADSLAALFLEDRKRVDPALSRALVTVSAWQGGLPLFRRYRTAFESAETPVLRSDFLVALGCFRDPAAADSALAYVLTGPLRPHEVMTIPRNMGRRRPLQERNADWIVAHLDTLLARVPKAWAIYIPWNAGHSGESWARRRPVFQAWQDRLPGFEKEMAKVDEAVRLLEDARNRDGLRVRDYLEAQAASPVSP